MTFVVDLQRFAEKAKHRADEVVGITVTRIAAELDYRSPVGDATYWISKPPPGYVGGRFRANWQLGIDTVPVGERPALDQSPKNPDIGGETTQAITASIPDSAAGHIFYLSNNVPYAQRIENGWSHRQAPQGLVGLTAQKFIQKVREAVEALP